MKMDTNGISDKAVVKHKVISSSKLQSINFKKSYNVQADVTSVENKIAAISFSQKSFENKTLKPERRLNLNLSNNAFASNDKLNNVDSPTQRFNPFDRSDESSKSSSSSSESKSCETSKSRSTSLDELGLTEDHFSGSMGLSSAEELRIAIDNCIEMIPSYPDGSKKKNKLMKNLVQLQVKLQDTKENSNSSTNNIKIILGHQLKKKKIRSLKAVCDCCKSSMWSLIPVWYECKECSYICHEKCIDNIRRSCVARIAKLSSYNLNICPEAGLSKQMYCCMECKNPIAVGTSVDKGRLCDYTGSYYCNNCHWDDSLVIPGRVVHNWDHTPQKVCRQSFQLLSKMYRLPVLNIEKTNPMLFNYVEELSEIKRMRENILKMKEYIRTCAAAKEAKLLQLLSNRQHFIENSLMYSMEDLVLTHSGQLTNELVKIHGIFAQHIKIDCMACQGKGFICEICNAGEALFPFDYMIAICPKCSAVFHSDCFSFIDKTCPRCRRKQEKRKLSKSIVSGADAPSSSEDENVANYFPSSSSSSRPATNPFDDPDRISGAYPSVYGQSSRDAPQANVISAKSPDKQRIGSREKPNQESRDAKTSLVFRDVEFEERFVHDRSDTSNHEVGLPKNPFSTNDVSSPPNPFSTDDVSSPTNPFSTDNVNFPTSNPFQVDDVDSPNNPFLNDVYDQSKNPFCC